MSSETTKDQIVSMLTNILSENDPCDSQYEPTTNQCISLSFSSEHSDNENETAETLSKPLFTVETITDNNSAIQSLSPRSTKKHFSHPTTSKQHDILLLKANSCDDTASGGVVCSKSATTPGSPNNSAFGVNNQNFEILLRKEQSINQTVYAIARGKISQLIKRQQTSRLLQYFLMNTDKHLVHLIFLDLVSDLHLLMFDLYANYFCYKLFSYLNQCDRIRFLSLIKDYIAIYATHHVATYPLQCIIEDIHDAPEQEVITAALNKLLNTNVSDVMAIATNNYGTHVFEKIMLRFEPALLQPLLLFFTTNISVLGTNPHGLCVVKKLVQVVYNNRQSMMLIFNEMKLQLQRHAHMLSQNPFGNYVLQGVLDAWHTKDSEEVMAPLHKDVLQLSSQKYSSNVVEKYLKVNSNFVLRFVNGLHIADCCCSPNEATCTVGLIKNTYGSYVLETVLQELKGEYLKQFILYLQKAITVLTQSLTLPTQKGDVVLYAKWLKKINYYYYTYYCGNVYYCD